MTDEQIIKALECCFLPSVAKECPRKVKGLTCNDGCERMLVTDALDLINRLQAEIAILKSDLMLKTNDYELLKTAYEKAENVSVGRKDRLMQKVVELQEARKEIEMLQNEKAKIHKLIPKMIKEAKYEAIKEFAERLKTNIDEGELYGKNYDYIITMEHIDNLVNEMTEPVKLEHNSLCETETYIKG